MTVRAKYTDCQPQNTVRKQELTVRAKLTDRQLQITVRISAAVLDMSGSDLSDMELLQKPTYFESEEKSQNS